jgi:multiple sugar transport system substrate-binding protein
MDRLDLVVDTLQQMNLKIDRRRLLQGGMFAGLNLTVLARLAAAPVAPVEADAATITMWAFPLTTNDAVKIWKPLTAKFAKENPGLHVKVTMLPWDNRQERMLEAFVSKSTPDVAYLNNELVIQWSQGNMLVPLDAYFSSDVLADFPANIVAGCRYNGKLMMIPILLTPSGQLYNMDLFKKIGADPTNPPATWDDLVALSTLAKKHGYYGLDLPLSNLSDFDTILFGAGGHYLSPDASKSTVNSPEGVAATTFIVKLYDNKWVPIADSSPVGSASAVDYFVTQKAVMSTFGDSGYALRAYQQMTGVNLGVAPLLKNKDQATTGAVGTLGIYTTTRNLPAAAKWVQFMMRPENLAFYNTVGGYTPPRATARKLWKTPPLLQQFGELSQYIRIDRDTLNYYEQEYVLVMPEVQNAVLHKKTPKQAMDAAAKAVDQYIAQTTGQS